MRLFFWQKLIPSLGPYCCPSVFRIFPNHCEFLPVTCYYFKTDLLNPPPQWWANGDKFTFFFIGSTTNFKKTWFKQSPGHRKTTRAAKITTIPKHFHFDSPKWARSKFLQMAVSRKGGRAGGGGGVWETRAKQRLHHNKCMLAPSLFVRFWKDRADVLFTSVWIIKLLN